MKTWCLLPTLICYFAATICYWFPLLGKGERWFRPATVLSAFGALLHAVYLGYLYTQTRLDPLATVSLGLILLYFFLIGFKPWQGLGSLFLPLGLVLFLFSLSSSKPIYFLSAIPGLVTLHLLLALAALVLFIGNFLLGSCFWIHSRQLKAKRWEALSWRLPPLLTNERSAFWLLGLGFVSLTLVLLTGSLLSADAGWGHIAGALTAWGCYGWLLQRRWYRGSGRKILLLSTLGFVSLWIAYLWN